MGSFQSFVRAHLAASVADLASLIGLIGFSYGFWLTWKPLGFIVGGLALFVLGILLGRGIAGQRRPS